MESEGDRPRLVWLGEAGDATRGDDWIVLDAPPGSDRFVDPVDGTADLSAPVLAFETAGDFVFSARASVEFGAPFDAGCLVVLLDDDHWAKCCFEATPAGEPSIVSAVNRGRCDDCNSVTTDRSTIHLRISRLGGAFAFHYSTGGSWWELVRLFPLTEPTTPIHAGFLAQSPRGPGCRVRFSDIAFEYRTLADPRSGH